MKPGDQVEVVNWKAPGWEGRRGVVLRVTKMAVWVRFDDWSPWDVEFQTKDASHLHVIA